jgi:hypothetical protein
MPDTEGSREFRRRAEAIRKIALCLFDLDERKAVLRFVDDSEKLLMRSGSDFKLP